jgi:Mn-dependent DtxR family transcriptional regulator
MSDAANYVLVVFQLAETESEPVPTGRVAAELDRSPSATTEMLQRLDEQGFLSHEPYEGVRLTDEGRERGAALQESYLVLRRFFDDVLGLADPHTEAMALVGTVSPLVTERLASTVFDVGETSTDTAGAGVHSSD